MERRAAEGWEIDALVDERLHEVGGFALTRARASSRAPSHSMHPHGAISPLTAHPQAAQPQPHSRCVAPEASPR